MKKVLFITHEASRTGAPLVLLSLIKSINKLGYGGGNALLVLDEGPIVDEFKQYIKVIEIYNYRGWRRFIPYIVREKINRFLFFKWAKKENFDLIYANTVGSLQEAINLKHAINKPMLLHIHESERTCIRRGITREMMLECDEYVAVSSLCIQALEHYRIPKDKIQVVHPFSDFMVNTKDIRPILIDGITEDTFVIGMSGAGNWRKGVDNFPLLVHRFVNRYPNVNVKFMWIGSLPGDEMEYDLKKLGVADKVIMPGVVSNPIEYYKRFDVFALMSREDPFPLVCMENAALANPIVLFENTSGIVDLVHNGRTGITVPYLDIDAMADAIFLLYKNKELRKNLGENLRHLLKEEFSKQRSIRQLLAILA